MVHYWLVIFNMPLFKDLSKQSDCITLGIPNTEMNWVVAPTTAFALILWNKVTWHITVNKYECLNLDRPRGPTQSMVKHSKDCSVTENHCKGAGFAVWFGLQVNRQVWHVLMNRATSFFKHGQKKNASVCIRRFYQHQDDLPHHHWRPEALSAGLLL